MKWSDQATSYFLVSKFCNKQIPYKALSKTIGRHGSDPGLINGKRHSKPFSKIFSETCNYCVMVMKNNIGTAILRTFLNQFWEGSRAFCKFVFNMYELLYMWQLVLMLFVDRWIKHYIFIKKKLFFCRWSVKILVKIAWLSCLFLLLSHPLRRAFDWHFCTLESFHNDINDSAEVVFFTFRLEGRSRLTFKPYFKRFSLQNVWIKIYRNSPVQKLFLTEFSAPLTLILHSQFRAVTGSRRKQEVRKIYLRPHSALTFYSVGTAIGELGVISW